MIKGIVHNNRPLISLIVGWKLGVQEIVALVDTGFTGELKLSPEKATELGLQTTHTETVMLADEKTVNMQASLAFYLLFSTLSTYSPVWVLMRIMSPSLINKGAVI